MSERFGYPAPSLDTQIQETTEHQEQQGDNELPAKDDSSSDDSDSDDSSEDE